MLDVRLMPFSKYYFETFLVINRDQLTVLSSRNHRSFTGIIRESENFQADIYVVKKKNFNGDALSNPVNQLLSHFLLFCL